MGSVFRIDTDAVAQQGAVVSHCGGQLALASAHADSGCDQGIGSLRSSGWGTSLADALSAYKEVWAGDVTDAITGCHNLGQFMTSFAEASSRANDDGAAAFGGTP